MGLMTKPSILIFALNKVKPMMRTIFGVAVLLAMGNLSLWAQGGGNPLSNGGSGDLSSLAPQHSNEFLKIGVSARAFGMGNAQVAIAEDVSGGYWNPAAMAHRDALAYPEVAFMHASYFANIASYHYGGFSLPIDESGDRRFGVTLIRFGVDDIPNTLYLIEEDGSINYDRVQSFSVTDFATLLSYAWRSQFIQGLSLGVNMKIIYRGFGNFGNGWGFGVDAAAHYQRDNFRAGLVLLDATNTFNAFTYNSETFGEAFVNTGNAVYESSIELTRPTVRFGAGYDLPLGRKLRLLTSVDLDIFTDGARPYALIKGGPFSLDPRLGLELAYLNQQYRKVAFLRLGAYNIQNIVDLDAQQRIGVFPTAGAGVVLRNFQIDYALANIGNLAQNLHSHVVSLKFHIQ
jgi:hypothetical protein